MKRTKEKKTETLMQFVSCNGIKNTLRAPQQTVTVAISEEKESQTQLLLVSEQEEKNYMEPRNSHQRHLHSEQLN